MTLAFMTLALIAYDELQNVGFSMPMNVTLSAMRSIRP
jgi:hypothetical protein